jgi:hypothetical protein
MESPSITDTTWQETILRTQYELTAMRNVWAIRFIFQRPGWKQPLATTSTEAQ